MSLKTNPSYIVSAFVAIVLLSPAFAGAQNVAVPTLTLTASKTSIVAVANPSYKDLSTISWTSTNTTVCRASGTGWSGSVALAGEQKVNPLVTTTYTMICTGTGGSITRSVTLTVIKSAQVANALSAYDQVTNNTHSVTAGTQTSFKYVWTHNLQVGSIYTNDVSALQTALTHEGVYSGEITGGFYKKTSEAVKLFQTKYSIESIGKVGPQTRAKLNALYGN